MEITYCGNCGLKIAPGELSAGKSNRTGDGIIYCSKCAPLFEHTTSTLLAVELPESVHDVSTRTAIPVAVEPPRPENSVTKFYFCETCGKRITDKQILEGLGRDKKLKGVFCKDCAVGVMTMEMDAINIEQLAKARPKTSSSPAFSPAEARSSPRKASGTFRPHEAPQRTQPVKPPAAGKTDRFPLLLALGAVAVIGVIVAAVALQSPAAPRGRESQTQQTEAGTNPPPSIDKILPAAPVKTISATPTIPAVPAIPAVQEQPLKNNAPGNPAGTQKAAGNVNESVMDGLAGYWKFDEENGAIAADSSEKRNNGTLVDGPEFSLDVPDIGISNHRSLNFDGKKALVRAACPPLDADNWSIAAWINPAALPQPEGMVVYAGNDRAGYGIAVKGEGLSVLYGSVEWIDTGYTLTVNKWFHVAVVRNNGRLLFYVNGALLSKTSVAAPGKPADYFEIGHQPQSGGRFFSGKIDDVRVYNRALLPEEVQLLANVNAKKADATHAPVVNAQPPCPVAPPQTAPCPVAPVNAVQEPDQLAAILKELAPLLRQNRFSEAEKLLDGKVRDPAFAEIAERLNAERSDLAEIRALRQSALDALRAKGGGTVTLTMRGTKVTGTVKNDPNRTDLTLALRNGPELTIKAEQLDVHDTDSYAPVATGDAKSRDLWRRGLLFLAAGDTAAATDFFTKARDAGMGDAAAVYLERIAALKLGEREVAALAAWKKAEAVFASKNWKAAQQAYDSFQRDYAGLAALANNAETLKKRQEAIDEALGPPRELSLDLGGGIKLELALIPAGEFEMGCNEGGDPNEKPVHTVKISRPFYMGKFLVTQAQYEKVGVKNQSHFKGENLPVDSISYIDAEEFCKKASAITGKPIRLPTEAEWEYACRAGTKTKYYTGDSDTDVEQAGWFKVNSEEKSHPVGQKKPNAWGLYDMHGNLWQWCQDWYAEDYYGKSEAENPQGPAQGAARVMRSGSWAFDPWLCRSARRSSSPPDVAGYYVGFRVVAASASKTP